MRIAYQSASMVLLMLLATGVATAAERPASGAQVLRLGAVAYSPAAVTVFQGMTRYLQAGGLPADFVLYSSYDALVAALRRGEIDIAWNTPLAHAQYHVASGCASQTLVMRDVDFGVRSVLIARADAAIENLSDLPEKRLVLGSSQAAEATVLPLRYLKSAGVDLDRVVLVRLDQEVDNQGNPCASPQHVLAAVRAGRGDAGIITESLCGSLNARPGQPELRVIWKSPAFSHCVFTASAHFDKERAAQFTRLMTAMRPDAPETADVMRLEGTRRWLPGAPDGFVDLVESLLRP